jgi:hypothetical protein
MNTIVVNTLTGAVSEYTGFGFQCLTPTHVGSATGLWALGGDTDDDQLIVSRAQTGKVNWGGSLKKSPGTVFFGIKGEGVYALHVSGENDDYTYSFTAASKGESRAQPGRGIFETYLSFGFSNPNGQDFKIDTVEVLLGASTSRRV